MALIQYLPGVFGWSRLQPDRGHTFNGTALVATGPDAGTVLLVDPVEPTPAELASLRALGERFAIVLLNADHERASARLATDLGAPVWAPAPDASRLRQSDVHTFQDGDTLPGGWRVHQLDGHKTPGESVLHHAERRVLVVGDAVIADPVDGLRLVPPARLPQRAPAVAALRTLLALDFDALIVGDGFSLPVGGKVALERFLQAQG